MLNFSAFSVQKTANERPSLLGTTRGQNFKLKFRKYLSKKNGKEAIETGYTFSNDRFKELGLEENGIIQIVSPEGVPYIAVVSNDDATMLKRTDKLKEGAEKGRKFKSTILDAALLAQGIIEDKEGATQFLDVVKIEGSEGAQVGTITAVAVYSIVKSEGEDDENEESAVEDTNVGASQATSTEQASEDAPADAPADTDDF